MELRLERKYKKERYTIGNLYVDGVWFCNTIEDRDRGLRQYLPLSVNQKRKIKNETAIPTGRYRVTLGVKSPKMSQRPAYNFCNGYVPRLVNVPAFDGILIHIGNTEKDSAGCIIVGENKVKGKVINSTETFKKLYDVLKSAEDNIYITIEEDDGEENSNNRAGGADREDDRQGDRA